MMQQSFLKANTHCVVIGFLLVWTVFPLTIGLDYDDPQQIEEMLVYPKILEERSQQGLYELYITDELRFTLKKTQPLARNFLVYHGEGNKFRKECNQRRTSGDVYVDTQNKTAVIIASDDGVRVKGVIQMKYMIEPTDSEESKNGWFPHVLTIFSNRHASNVHKNAFAAASQLSSLPAHHVSVPANNSSSADVRSHLESRILEKRPKVVTVRTCVLISSKYLTEFKKSNHSEVTDVVDYMALFFTFVNMFLEKFNKAALDLQLRVVRIVLLQEETESFIKYTDEEKTVIAGESLKDLNDYVTSNINTFSRPAVALYLSSCQISTPRADGIRTVLASGYTNVGGACTDGRGVFVHENPRTYEGVLTTVHEVLHSLGSVHDGQAAPRHLPESPGALMCPWNGPTVMVADLIANMELGISQCTEAQVLAFLRSNRAYCLVSHIHRHKRSIVKTAIRSALLNTLTFCNTIVPKDKAKKFSPAVDENALKLCRLSCTWQGEDFVDSEYRNAPDYTPCGFEDEVVTKICLHGVCTPLPAHLYTFPRNITLNA